MVARNPDIKRLNRRFDVSHLRGLLTSSTMAPVGRDGDLYLPGGKSSNGDWSAIGLFLAACPKIMRSLSSRLSLVRARPVVGVRDVLHSRVRSFAVLSSQGSLPLKLAYPSAASFSLFLLLFLFLSSRATRELRSDVVVPVARRSFQSNAFAVSSRSVE